LTIRPGCGKVSHYEKGGVGLQRVEKQLPGIEERWDGEISIRERLEKEVSDLKQRVAVLQREIEEIEIRLKTIS
jgi:hypothetical protein